ncbi:amidase [Cryobacterium algoritolerans]|uniref:Amidase n=1 Tax=Cryobacterium algoritolerans TaxID=1259184 RepID=A0A4R8WW80_9MICO|nr:amidase [Cryobacterium algoritolerans]TFC19734.1 amidase [Cryobacterium algoritolerans]
MALTETIQEITIEEVQAGYRSGAYTAREIVQAYLDRIAAIDTAGPALNSIITVSSTALAEADALDSTLAKTGNLVGSLHGVPIVVKDQIETAGILTTFGSEASGDYVPSADATAIGRLRDAGAIILGKTTMPDFATSWFSTSSRSGITKNPYDLSRDPGGSSSGSAAAVAANLSLVGIGEDTGGSIRLPSSFCNLVGLRTTPGLISRTGMSSLVKPQDTAGPMTRTVTDAARVLDVLVGFDAADPYTAAYVVADHKESYTAGLADASVAGKRIGVLRQAFGDPSDVDGASVNAVIEEALVQLADAGAVLVDIEIPDLDHYVAFTSVYFSQSLRDMNAFLASRPALGIESIEKLYAEKRYHEKLDLLEGIATGPSTPKDDPEYLDRILAQGDFQRSVIGIIAQNQLDVIAFPDIKLTAPTHDDVFTDRWTCITYPTNTVIASQLLFPAISVPAGFTSGGLPVGLELMAVPFDESSLLQVARGVEVATHARRAPVLDASYPVLEAS